MKKTSLLSPVLYSLGAACLHAAMIAQWNFNSPTPDGDTTTGTNAPSVGRGTATLVGGTTADFISGDSKHDPAGSIDNSSWSTKHYPAAISNNLTAGVRFDVDTTGYENISIDWCQQNSATASRYSRLQFTPDGLHFTNGSVIFIRTNSAFTNQTVILDANTGARNNPNFGFQILTEFEHSATGAGTNAYVATGTNAYGTTGTIRYEMMTVSGTVIPGANTAPNISGIPDQAVHVSQSTAAIPFTVWDLEDSAGSLTLSRWSSDPSAVPVGNIGLTHSGSNCTVTVTAAGFVGSSAITLWVKDSGGRSNSAGFTVRIYPTNTAPVISAIGGTNIGVNGTTVAIPFTVGDWETAAESLAVTGASWNTALVPDGAAGIVFGGSGSNRTVTVKPVAGQTGVAPIQVRVSDGNLSSGAMFPVLVTGPELFCDWFGYPDGSLVTNSAGMWGNRSGTSGECRVSGGQVILSGDASEDADVALPGGPYLKDKGTVLYASFKARFGSLPKTAPCYFAGFANGSTVRGRVYAGLTNSSAGHFSLLTSTASDTNTVLLAAELSTNTSYTVVTRYAVDTTATKVWLNPTSESDPGASSTDSPTVTTISHYALREATELGGALWLDDLRIGLTFASVVGEAGGNPLQIEPSGHSITLRWSGAGLVLQGAPTITGPFTNVTGATSPFTVPASGAAGFFRLR